MILLLCYAPAQAAPIVWTQAPTAEQRALVTATPDAGPEITLATLVDRASGPDDPAGRYTKLEATLKSVRAYETRLDGERIIMDDLQVALDRIQVVRDAQDRTRLFGALAYQGFAVHRFFGDALDAEDAAPWRVDLGGKPVPSPWRDAVAIAPDREVSAYDIAEAPQRVAFSTTRGSVLDALPGGIRLENAERGVPYVDGEPVDATAAIRLPPGRHYVHLVVAERIVAHQAVSLDPGATVTVDLGRAGDPDLTGLAAGAPVPDALRPLLGDGTVWIATPEGRSATVLAVSSEGVIPVSIGAAKPVRDDDDREDGLYAVASLGAGWFESGDFYNQDPLNAPHTAATVNAISLNGGIGVGLQRSVFRAELGFDALYTVGAHHTALSGAQGYRLRATPHAAAGLTWLMVTGGAILPYHPYVGARAALPLPAGFEVRGDFRAGIPLSLKRPDGTAYSTLPVFSLAGAVAFRFGPGARTSTL